MRLSHVNNASRPSPAVYSGMGKRLDWQRKKAPRDAIQIGAGDGAPTSLKQVWRQTRERLVLQRPDLSYDEIERRVGRIVYRGLRPAA